MKPIFMIGTQRSGSNLLRLMLNQLPELAAPHPPHILQRMTPLLSEYGDLSRPKAFAELVDDVVVLDSGRVIYHGDIAGMRRSPAVIEAYLGTESHA